MEIFETWDKKMGNFNLQERLNAFAVMIVEVVRQLPRDQVGLHFGGQLLRSGTSPALHYGEAQAASSRKDFIHKMRICLKELRETYNCLSIMACIELLQNRKILAEANELVAIFQASVNKAEGNR